MSVAIDNRTMVVSDKEADLIYELRKIKYAKVLIFMENYQPDRIEYTGMKKLGIKESVKL